MKPFNPDATCPKCGNDEISSCHVPERLRLFISCSDNDQEPEEHIRRRCTRCYYRWNEATLDREEAE
jgi:transcription elongation factor Elf1